MEMSPCRLFSHYIPTISIIITIKLCALVTSTSPSVSKGSFPGEGRIVGGVETEKHEFPEMLAGIFSGQISLIRHAWGLTAAHCCTVAGGKPLEEWVFGGKHQDRDDEPQQIRANITKVVVHPAYDYSLKNDICLLKLDPPFTYSDIIQPIALPPRDYKGLDCAWVVSFKRHCQDEPNCTKSTKLHKVDVPILPEEKCEEWLNDEQSSPDPMLKYDRETMLCAGYEEGGKDSCTGDSGGPILIIQEDGKHVQVGITSWGFWCAKPKQPGVYTRLAGYVDWIEKTIAEDESGQS